MGTAAPRHRRDAAAVACLAALAGSSPANAETVPDQPTAWSYELVPYLWASRLNGQVEAATLPAVSVSIDFPDVLKTLDFGFMGAFEARSGRWGLLLDGIYTKNSGSATASRADIGVEVDAELKLKQTLFAAAVAYRVVEGDSLVDLVVGGRYNHADADAKINASLYGLNGSVARSGDKAWTDPYVGVRVIHPLSERWKAVAYADVGGFHVASKFAWQGIVGLKYANTESVATDLGYRIMKIDFERDSFAYDMRTDGLYVGLGVRF